MHTGINQVQKNIYTVTELTSNIKTLLEERFPFVWVSGEISNFSIPVSGHFYFTLKDDGAQISAVMFRGQNKSLKFELGNGLSITGLGRVSVYEPRGSYQLILEYIEPKGIGALQIAFEQLKERLFKEGLFDKKHKQPLPFLPKKIGLITSPTGSVLHDFLRVACRRFPNIPIEIFPVQVQGTAAANDIISALKLANSMASPPDVVVIARGGGSLEDLAAFNCEDVARAVFLSSVPVVSAIGHETDFTIVDFVADFRASTPSAAAEIVVPKKNDLLKICFDLSRDLNLHYIKYIENMRGLNDRLLQRLIDPKKHIDNLKLKTDDVTFRLVRAFESKLKEQRMSFAFYSGRLDANNPLKRIELINEKLELLYCNVLKYLNKYLSNKQVALKGLKARLNTLSPVEILKRGYSIVRTVPDKRVVMDARLISIGEKLEIMMSKGSALCRVEEKLSEETLSNEKTNI
jgi:exodeoxyribonuclease VII large subunit